MNKTAPSLVLVAGIAAMAGSLFVGPADAAPHALRTVACAERDPVGCLDRQGESAAEGLSEAYAQAAVELDTTCADVVELGMGACLEHAQRIADLALNASYTRYLRSIDSDEQGRQWREEFERAQKAWLGFREADCGGLIGSEWQGGTGTGVAVAVCRLGKTEERAAELGRRSRR